MKIPTIVRCTVLGLAACIALGTINAQTAPPEDPGLPYQQGSGPERLGLNSFGGNMLTVPGIHSEQFPLPPIDDLITPPIGPRRHYIVIRYYAVRPWFIHPYTGATLKVTDLIRSVQSDNPDWVEATAGRSLDELLQVDPRIGEPIVDIQDMGLVDEKNEAIAQEFAEETQVETANAEAAGVALGKPPTSIIHSPGYGLYCLSIRICIPYLSTAPGQVYRYWVRWGYSVHQRWCWSDWWWYRWCNVGGVLRICPYRPLCIPHAYWTRVGPDWIWHVTNPNRFRYWCLFAHRYYFTLFGTAAHINPVPLTGQLQIALNPNPALSTGWRLVWPYPRVRYWPYRPYFTRWYWYRCLPWFNYRYLPPVIQAAFAIPKKEFGAGFLPAPDDNEDNPSFPTDPPRIDDKGMFDPGTKGDSFFDLTFDIAGVCTVRPLVKSLGDSDGNGLVSSGDHPRPIREEQFHERPIDLGDSDLPAVQ